MTISIKVSSVIYFITLRRMLWTECLAPLQNSYVEVLTPRGAVFGRGAFKEMHECVLSRSVISNSLQPHGLQPARLLCPWDFPGKNNGVACHFLLQGIFLTQGSSLCPNAGGLGLIRGQQTRSYMLQLKIPHPTTKPWCGQIN